jgi:thiamine-phosphate pyrophosphorylase
MPLTINRPLTYLITSGKTTSETTPRSEDFARLLELVRAGVEARVDLIQIREKELSARTLYELACAAALMTRESETRLLINDRADIARAAEANGVHLTARSLSANVIRQTFGAEFLIGVSTHTPAEARRAREDGADFAVFGHIFDTPSKRNGGAPLGLELLRAVCAALKPFPILALGGITRENARECLAAGAAGIAGISLFQNAATLAPVIASIHNNARE